MIIRTVAATILALSSVVAEAQAVYAPPRATTVPTGTSVLVRRDTPVVLMATKEVSTADASPGTMFRLRVHQPIEIDGKILIPVGTTAWGRVETASDSGGLGKSGRMTARLLHIQLGDAQIPLDGETSAKGQGAGSAGVAFIFAGAIALFHRGNNAKIKAGELMTGFVAEDVLLDLSTSPVTRITAQPAVTPAAQ